MESFMKYLLYLHVAFGSLSLVAFWAPVFTAKGKKAHRIIGWIYVGAMSFVVASAAVLSGYNLANGRVNIGLFLGFLSLLSANPLWQGIAILRNKRNPGYVYRFYSIAFQTALGLSGAGLLVYGLFFVQDGIRVLMIFFGVIGLNSIRDAIRQRRQWKTGNTDWYRLHYAGMITSGIAAYTAFFAFGGRQFFTDLLPGMWQVVPWILPTFIGVTAMRIMDRSRSKRTSAKTQTTNG